MVNDHASKSLGTPLAFDDWPVEDRLAWDRAIQPGDPFTDAGGGAHWRPATRTGYRDAYGRVLAFLQRRGWLNDQEPPASRIRREWIVAYIEELERRLKPVSIWSYISDLHNAVYRMLPGEDWSWLRDIVNRLHGRVTYSNVSAADLVPIDDIYRFGLELMRTAEKAPPRRPLNDSVLYRDGLMLALAAASLVRLGNFATIRLNESLLRTSEGFALSFAPEAVKNRQSIEGPLPGTLTPFLEHYLDHHHPRLLGGRRGDDLWISTEGRIMKPHHVGKRIAKLTSRYLGKQVPLQRFRHCAATSIATTSPELARIIRPLLAHTTNRTGELYYNRARMVDASRRHASAISNLKRKLQNMEDISS